MCLQSRPDQCERVRDELPASARDGAASEQQQDAGHRLAASVAVAIGSVVVAASFAVAIGSVVVAASFAVAIVSVVVARRWEC